MSNNVISVLFGAERKKSNKSEALIKTETTAAKVEAKVAEKVDVPSPASSDDADAKSNDFRAIAARNREAQDRLRKERDQANKAVLKSYRIK
jgi:hypothetical protein